MALFKIRLPIMDWINLHIIVAKSWDMQKDCNKIVRIVIKYWRNRGKYIYIYLFLPQFQEKIHEKEKPNLKLMLMSYNTSWCGPQFELANGSEHAIYQLFDFLPLTMTSLWAHPLYFFRLMCVEFEQIRSERQRSHACMHVPTTNQRQPADSTNTW